MTRLFILGSLKEGQKVRVAKQERHYLLNVLRLGPGGNVKVVDDDGNEFSAAICNILANGVELEILKKLAISEQSPLSIHLYVGLLKGKKMERVVTDAVELGVVSITPFVSSRTVPTKIGDERLLRLRKISKEQSRLSMRTVIPEVFPHVSYSAAVSHAEGKKMIFFEGERGGFPKEKIAGKPFDYVVSLFTGPEGGFSDEEIELATKTGFCVVGLGGRILRAETAPGVAIAIIQYKWGDLKGR